MCTYIFSLLKLLRLFQHYQEKVFKSVQIKMYFINDGIWFILDYQLFKFRFDFIRQLQIVELMCLFISE